MPNSLAHLMLFGWPILAGFVIKGRRASEAAVLLLLVPYLLLPYGFGIDLPLLPPIDKSTLPSLVALFYMRSRYYKFSLIPDNPTLKLLLFLSILYPLCTALANGDALVYGPTVRPGLTISDIISMEFNSFTNRYVPVMLGATFLATAKSHRDCLRIFIIAGVIYTIPSLWEVRMSPQLHAKFYGYFPHSFGQQMRDGGFRPVVFLGHGLYVAMFIAMSSIACAVFWKAKFAEMKKFGFLKMTFMIVVLALCKTWSAVIYAVLALLIIQFTSTKVWTKVAFVFALIVFLYPMLRAAEIIPTDDIYEFFLARSEDRAQSLGFRFMHEDWLLEKANERSLFGWGGWGRQRIWDPISGEDLSVIDGTWVGVYGAYGWLGYLSFFGLLCIPIFLLMFGEAKKTFAVPIYTAGLGFLLAINLVDLLPNSSLNSITFLIAGAIFGYVNRGYAVDESLT